MSRRLNRLNPLSYLPQGRDLPNTFDVVMNSLQTLQHELGRFKAIAADAVITPDVADFAFTDFDRALELIERGAAATRASLPQLERALAARGLVTPQSG